MRSSYSAIPLLIILHMSSIVEPGSLPSGASLERNVGLTPGLTRTAAHIPLMELLVTHLIFHHHRVTAKNLSLWIDYFLMKLQAWLQGPLPRMQGEGCKVSLAPFCTLTMFQSRMTEHLLQVKVYKSG